jgi:hypothetical protein
MRLASALRIVASLALLSVSACSSSKSAAAPPCCLFHDAGTCLCEEASFVRPVVTIEASGSTCSATSTDDAGSATFTGGTVGNCGF